MDDPERMMERFAREVIDGILSGAIRSREELQTVKLKMSHRYRLEAVPLNSAILAHVRQE